MSSIWIFFTLMAAFMQAWRNAFQKQLSLTIDVYGVTLARFIFGFPFALLYVYILSINQVEPTQVTFTARYWLYIVVAGISQITATALMVQLFKQKNYAIGVGLAKSEAILAAMIAAVMLNDQLTLLGWGGVILGGVAVFLLSQGNQKQQLSVQTLAIGIGSGLCFAMTSLLVREASLELTNLAYIDRAAWVLLSVITFQCFIMLLFLGIFRPKTLLAMWQQKGLTFKVSVCSFLASLGWFTAMSMQSVAIVKTLGQIEILFSLLISIFFFKEKLAKTEHIGLILVVIAVMFVIWA